MGLVRFGTGLMKNPHPDKEFFHFFEKILNGQAKDLSLSGSTESLCSQYRAVCLEFFRRILRGPSSGRWKAKPSPKQDTVVPSSDRGELATD
jgi:hypothetical protein